VRVFLQGLAARIMRSSGKLTTIDLPERVTAAAQHGDHLWVAYGSSGRPGSMSIKAGGVVAFDIREPGASRLRATGSTPPSTRGCLCSTPRRHRLRRP